MSADRPHAEARHELTGPTPIHDACVQDVAVQYGAMFKDGTVTHRWNGRTQRQRITEFMAVTPGCTLVSRATRTSPWHEVTAA
jgi:hypothetical protein